MFVKDINGMVILNIKESSLIADRSVKGWRDDQQQ